MMKSQKNQSTSKNTTMIISIAPGISLGAAVGLCGGSATGASGGKKKENGDTETKNGNK